MKKSTYTFMLMLCTSCIAIYAQMIINWPDKEIHIEAAEAYEKYKNELFKEFEEEVTRIEHNARILRLPVIDLMRKRIFQLSLEAESMIRTTLRKTITPLWERERDILVLRRKISLLHDELDKRR